MPTCTQTASVFSVSRFGAKIEQALFFLISFFWSSKKHTKCYVFHYVFDIKQIKMHRNKT